VAFGIDLFKYFTAAPRVIDDLPQMEWQGRAKRRDPGLEKSADSERVQREKFNDAFCAFAFFFHKKRPKA